MKTHIATVAHYGMVTGNRIGTAYIYNAEDYLKMRTFMAEHGKPFHVRWRNEECRRSTEACLAALRTTAPEER